jgi:hypothetical protein
MRGIKIMRRILELAILGAPVLVLFPLSQHLSARAEKDALASGSHVAKKKGDDGVLARMGVPSKDHGGSNTSSKANEIHLESDDLLNSKSQQSSYVDRLLWRYLRWSIARAGPTSIKMAQWAATRDDLFPEELCGRCYYCYYLLFSYYLL